MDDEFLEQNNVFVKSLFFFLAVGLEIQFLAEPQFNLSRKRCESRRQHARQWTLWLCV